MASAADVMRDVKRESIVADPVDVGIDLGTTYSVVARLDERGAPVAIPNTEGELTTPSVVHVNDDGTFIVGKPATAYGTNTVRAFKRFMGEDKRLALAGREYTAEQLSAEVLRKLVRDAAAALGAPVERAVISVPAHFGNVEREATRRAGQAAGLTVLQIINEPTAAADVYVSRRSGQALPGHLIVFDLGGGTLDITLIETEVEGATVNQTVRRTDGTVSLGGQNFTDELTRLFTARYKETHGLDLDDVARAEVGRCAEAAKLALSSGESAAMVGAAQGGPKMTLNISRPEFEHAIRKPLREIEGLTEMLIYSAGLEPKDIGKVLLAGGSSRVPSVRAAVRKIFGQEPDESLDPDLAVAWGAALRAGRFAKGSGDLVVKLGDITVVDCVTQPIGVKTARGGGYAMDVVLPEGAALEKWSAPRRYAPRQANEAAISVEVYQGKQAELENNLRLGAIVVELPAGSRPDNTDIRVWMRLNLSGILETQVSINGADPIKAEFRV